MPSKHKKWNIYSLLSVGEEVKIQFLQANFKSDNSKVTSQNAQGLEVNFRNPKEFVTIICLAKSNIYILPLVFFIRNNPLFIEYINYSINLKSKLFFYIKD
jgi:hypothetical protein